jgi:hypothetical protein
MSTGQHVLQQAQPVDAPGLRIRVRLRHVQRSGDAQVTHCAQQGDCLGAVVQIHAAHERRVAKVKNTGVPHLVQRHIRRAKGVVGAGAVQEDAVDARRVDHQRVGRIGGRIDDHSLGQCGS